MVVKDFNLCILKAAQETIPGGAKGTTDHTGVKNYKTSRTHCQKPEQQQKSILHRRTTPNFNKPKPDFSGIRYRHAAEAGEKKTASLNFENDCRKLWKLTNQFSDKDNSRERSPWKKTARN